MAAAALKVSGKFWMQRRSAHSLNPCRALCNAKGLAGVTPCQRPKQTESNTMNELPEYTQDQIEALEDMHRYMWEMAMEQGA